MANSGRYLPLWDSLSTMQEVRLTIRKRAFPSQGRVRFNVAHLPELGIQEGERVDLINEGTKKSVPLQEKLSKAAAEANMSLSKGVSRLDKAARKTVVEVKTGAEKTADAV